MRSVALVTFFLVCASARADNYLVLPFFNRSGDKSINWIGDSIAEAAHDALASEGLIVVERVDREQAYQRLSIRPYALLTKASVIKIAQALDAEQVIYGEYDLKPAGAADTKVKSRGSLTMTAHVLDLKHMQQGPEFGEVGALEDLSALQRHLAWQALRSVDPKDAPSEAEFVRTHPAVRADAIENYVRGLLASGFEEKQRWFAQAAHIDEHYSQPCFELGRLFFERAEYKAAADWLQKVSANDVHAHEATFLLGICRFHMGDFAGAEGAFQSLANMVPLNEVYNNLGAAESRMNAPRALDDFRKALEGDPSDPQYHFNVGYVLWKQGNFAAAAQSFQAVLERKPDDADAQFLLARSQKQSGPRPGETRTEGLERLKTNYEESVWWQLKAALQARKEKD